MPKSLIYTTLWGTTKVDPMLEVMNESARRCGFDGDIAVITDRDNIEIKEYGPPMLRFRMRPSERYQNEFWYFMHRAKIHEFLDVRKYESVAYVDIDCGFTKNPQILLDHAVKRDRMCLFEEPGGAKYAWHTCLYFRKKGRTEGLPAYNAGVFATPAYRLENDFSTWHRIFDKYEKKPKANDQNSLCFGIYSNDIVAEKFPTEWIAFPKVQDYLTGEEVVVHWCGKNIRRTKVRPMRGLQRALKLNRPLKGLGITDATRPKD